ncbi:hypothetical protein Pmi06nite_61750 [Planotetraspora mira]|uniref:Uncharacterized protein n=1 Tax=Planotetraspora mira TaxID=58121 RepID=A0A8J3XDQ9_9ACTN|nr:hypothetical protein Pmi06nite_61750 [Planotetraspora mira]
MANVWTLLQTAGAGGAIAYVARRVIGLLGTVWLCHIASRGADANWEVVTTSTGYQVRRSSTSVGEIEDGPEGAGTPPDRTHES